MSTCEGIIKPIIYRLTISHQNTITGKCLTPTYMNVIVKKSMLMFKQKVHINVHIRTFKDNKFTLI